MVGKERGYNSHTRVAKSLSPSGLNLHVFESTCGGGYYARRGRLSTGALLTEMEESKRNDFVDGC